MRRNRTKIQLLQKGLLQRYQIPFCVFKKAKFWPYLRKIVDLKNFKSKVATEIVNLVRNCVVFQNRHYETQIPLNQRICCENN